MIQIRLLSEPEYEKMRRDRSCVDYKESMYYTLLREKQEFTDPESLALLRYLHGETVVREKLYRCTNPEGGRCLPAISREAMYGLVVLENSRKGVYTSFEEEFSGDEVTHRIEGEYRFHYDIPLVWDVFAAMKQDILLTFRKKDFSFAWDIPIECNFVLENYSWHGVSTEVHVVDSDDESEERADKRYVENFFYDQQYRWTEDLEEVLESVRQETIHQLPLAKGEFTLTAFQEMCGQEDFGRFDWEPYDQPEEPWTILNHMDFVPQTGESRRLLYLVIEAYHNGRVCLDDVISVKYPNYGDMLTEAMAMGKENCEVLILPVDVNEVMGYAEDVRKALCAFRVSDNVVETFGPTEGLMEFARVLKKVIKSGKCIAAGEE